MWPVFVDYSDDESKKALRDLELEAYSSVINAFRAQGTLTEDRKRLLTELSQALSIPIERHKAEVRRVINDEHLSTVAERLSGPNTIINWAIEGRPTIPMMARLAPHTIFTEVANSAATAQAAKNTSLPLPGMTGCREVASGIETMACRKRKEVSSDWLSSPCKITALDSQYYDSQPSSPIQEPLTVPEIPMICESSLSPEIISPVSSLTDINASINTTTSFMASPSSSSKHSVPLKTPTLSSFDQLTSNLLASRAASKTFVPAVLHEEQVSTVCDATLQCSDLISAQKPLSSHSTVKTSSNTVTPTLSSSSSSSSSASSASSSKERLQNLPCSSQSNKFLSQIRTKTPTHARQNLPAGLGIKLSPQSHANQRNVVSPKSPIKATAKDNSPIFKKTSSPSDNPSSNNESISAVPKSPKSKTECQLNAKPQQTAKNLPKTTQQNSQFVSRSLFSTATGKSVTAAATKSQSPVIFNVSSPSCTAMQTAPKTTGALQSEAGKSTTQLVTTKTNVAVGMATSHVKINTSNAQTFHYRNDGGMVRSARIVNISQPVGSRLPCAISPSAISALGLSANISSTALRVTLPAGSLNTNSIRVAAAQKPNVIVVHKAQMYQRPSQGGAVIMTSAPMSKVSNDIAQETYSVTHKQDKNKPSGSKTTSRAVPSVRPQSPAVSVAEKTSDAQCKKNLLADIMEASGILLENTARQNALLKEKNNALKNNKELTNHQEVEIISQKGPISSTSETTSIRLSESSISKLESANNLSGNTALTVASLERNGVDTQKQEMTQAQSVESQSKDTCNTVVSLHITNENVTSSSECGSEGGHLESTKEDS